MKNRKLIWVILKRTHTDKLLYGYLLWLFISALILLFIEPNITSYGDSLWYCFSVLSTIGFGDVTVVTAFGRVISVVLSVYSILMIALIPGIITSYYLEYTKLRSNESVEKFLFDLERLPELSKEELAELSEKVKKFQRKNDK